MKIFYNLKSFLRSCPSRKGLVVTLGVFDGVHRAHQGVIKALVKKAKSRLVASALITFNPHPANVLDPPGKPPFIISLEHRLRLLEDMGIDYVIVLCFNERFARMSAADFVKKVLRKIRIDEIVVGSNFFFGRGKTGSLKDLKRFGYKVNFIKTVRDSGKAISSTRIRNLILKGELKKASRLLSRPVTVLGTVVRGNRRGRIIGYPTANINPHHEAIPPSGVYAVKIRLGKTFYGGILNIGTRPTFESGRDPTIEAHIFGFNKRIYGKEIEIIFVKKIREEIRFRDMHGLKAQIKKDETRARRILR